MPFAIINKDGSEAIAVGVTEAEAWDSAGLDAKERLNYRAVAITEEPTTRHWLIRPRKESSEANPL